MTALDPRIRALVDAARADEPTVADWARVRAALAVRLGAPLPGNAPNRLPARPTTLPDGPPAPAPVAIARGVAAKLLSTAALLGAIGVLGSVFQQQVSAPAVPLARPGIEARAQALVARVVAPAAVPSEVHAEPTADPGPPQPPSPPAPPPPQRPGHATGTMRAPPGAAPGSAPTPPGTITLQEPPDAAVASSVTPPPTLALPAPLARGSLVEETALLRRAQTSLGTGDAAGALARLDELGARYPAGLLREERLAARIGALCAAGREGEARREAERFLLEAPLSIHAARVRASCGRPAR